MILQGTGDNLRSGGRTGIDQYGKRDVFDFGRQAFKRVGMAGENVIFRPGGQAHAVFAVAAFGADHFGTFRQEGGRYAHRAVKQAAGVVAQVQNQALERGFVFFGQLLHCFAQRGDGAFLELADADVAVARLDQFGAHALHFDDGAGELEGQRFGRVFARNGQFDVGAGFAAHFFYRIAHCHAACGFVVNFHDKVAAFHACAFGGGVFNRRDHFHKAVFRANFHAQAAKFARGGLFHFGVAFFVHVFRMRV